MVLTHMIPLRLLYFQVLQDFYVKRVIDLVAGDALFAYACLWIRWYLCQTHGWTWLIRLGMVARHGGS